MSVAHRVERGSHAHGAVWRGAECSRALCAVGIRGHIREMGVSVRDWGVEWEHEEVSPLVNINNARGK